MHEVKVIVVLAASLICAWQACADVRVTASSHIKLAGIANSEVQRILQSIYVNAEDDDGETGPLPAGSAVPSTKGKSDFWTGSKVKINTSINGILEFKHPDYKNGSETSHLIPFELFVEYKEDKFTLRSSAPASGRYRGGIRAPFRKDRRRDVFLKGWKDTSIIAVFPAYGGPDNRAVLLCPRRQQVNQDEEDEYPEGDSSSVLEDSGYILTHVSFKPDASAEGEFTASGKPGIARASILTTENIPESVPFEDVTKSRSNPSVDLRYIPAETGGRFSGNLKTRFDGDTKEMWGGIYGSVELATSVGLVKKNHSQSVFYVREVRLERPLNVEFNSGDYYLMRPGRCYLVLNRTTSGEKRVDNRQP